MSEFEKVADELYVRRNDPGEWDETPEQVRVRPSGKQVISARLPTELAHEVIADAQRRGVKLSDVVRDALEKRPHLDDVPTKEVHCLRSEC